FPSSAAPRSLHSFPTRRSSDLGDVDAAGRDVGGDHDLVLAGLESLERLHALRLRAVGVEDGDRMIGSFQFPGDLVGAMLRARKQDRKSTRLNSSHDQISYAVFC